MARSRAAALIAAALWAAFVVAALIFPSSAPGEALTGRVVSITDGDTFTLLVDRQRHEIRIAQVDTPERGKPWSRKAKEALAKLIFGKTVHVEVVGTSHQRLVGEVLIGEVSVGRELIRAGHGWAADGYVTDRSLYRLEEEARRDRRGLWSLDDDAWSQAQPGSRAAAPRPQAVASLEGAREDELNCGAKKECSQMASCREARFYLDRCGLTGIDGDEDGVPCEQICPGGK